MQTRLERYSKIRRLLGRPREQRPDADQILSQMLMDESTLLLKLANTGQPWNVSAPVNVRVYPGKQEYRLGAEPGNDVGKIYFVTYLNGANRSGEEIPVVFTDFNDSGRGTIRNPAGDGVHIEPYFSPNSGISFVRRGGEIFAHLNRSPASSGTYRIYSFAGTEDRYSATMDGNSAAAELVDYTDLNTALALLPYAEWRSDDAAENQNYNINRQNSIGKGLMMQLQRLEPLVEDFIMTLNQPTTFDMPYWNE